MNAIERVLSRLPDARKTSAGWQARCPAHSDRSPSLSVRQGREGVVVHCFADCETREIVAALALEMRDLFDDARKPHESQHPRSLRPPTSAEVKAALFSEVERIRNEESHRLGHVPTETSDHRNAARHIISIRLGVNLAPVPPLRAELAENKKRVLQALAGRRSIFSAEGARGAAYLSSRGIVLDQAHDAVSDVRFHPHWFGKGPAVVFAVRNHEGNLVAAQGRFLKADAEPKALSLGCVNLGVFATPGALESKVLGITEAPIDALSLAACALPSLALLGTGRKPWFWAHLKAKRVILATDADAAGDRAADYLRRTLELSACVRFMFPVGCKDANEAFQCCPGELVDRVRTLLAAYEGVV